VLGRDRWDADGLRDMVRDYVTEHLADENAVLVIDETGFLKQGKASCGVAGNILVRRAKLRTVRSVFLLPTCRVTAMLSSIGRSICRRAGPTIRFAYRPHIYRTTSAFRPSLSLRST